MQFKANKPIILASGSPRRKELFSKLGVPLNVVESDTYIAVGDSLDKAGGYVIQSSSALFVKGIEGDYYAVMGLPIAALSRYLLSINVLSLKGDA